MAKIRNYTTTNRRAILAGDRSAVVADSSRASDGRFMIVADEPTMAHVRPPFRMDGLLRFAIDGRFVDGFDFPIPAGATTIGLHSDHLGVGGAGDFRAVMQLDGAHRLQSWQDEPPLR